MEIYDIPCFGCGKISEWSKPLKDNETMWCGRCWDEAMEQDCNQDDENNEIGG